VTARQTILRIRDVLKSRLSREQVLALRRVESGVAHTFVRALALLPKRQQTQIKSLLDPIGVLDYPHAEIKLALSDAPELMRLRSCTKEPETVAWIEQNLRPDDVLFDIGANVGAYSLVAASIRPGCRVFAFEPSFSTFASLSRNIHLNGLAGRVVPLQIALSDRTGMIEFQYRDLRAGAAEHASDGDARFDPVYRQPTLGYRLDDFIAELGLPLPNLVKIDVDGGEERVLAGAPKLLASAGLRSLQIELAQDRSRALVELIERAGLRLVAHRERSAGIANYVFAR
jgi:FkbM family methyltransferase